MRRRAVEIRGLQTALSRKREKRKSKEKALSTSLGRASSEPSVGAIRTSLIESSLFAKLQIVRAHAIVVGGRLVTVD